MKNLKNISLFSLVLAGLVASGLTQAQTIYTDRPTFETDNPGLATEDFETGQIGAGGAKGCAAPMDDTGAVGCFAPGDLLPGVTYAVSAGIRPDGIFLGGDGFGGTPTRNIGANFFVDYFIMDFSAADNTAVGMDVSCKFSPDTVNINIYGAGGLITTEQSGCTNAGVFFGVAAGEAITRIEIISPGNQAEGVDNLSFGMGTPVDRPPVARFAVTKDFSDNNSQDVDVHITCDTGLPLTQSFTISDSQAEPGQAVAPAQPGVVFVVRDYTDGDMNCTVTETPVPGYTPDYNADGDSQNEDDDPLDPGCHFIGIGFGDINSCTIDNNANPATFTAWKEWNIINDGGDEVNENVPVTISCNSEIFTSGAYESGDTWYLSDVIGDGGHLAATVDTTEGTATCWATENVTDSGVESTDNCGPRPIIAGGSSSCTFINTVFFEGIPTLSQYGLALLALLMLGVGMVGFRRFV